MKMQRTPGRGIAPTNSTEDKRQRYTTLAAQLKNARTSFEPTWKSIASFFRPRRIRLQVSDRNRGDQRNQSIVDSTPVYAARTCAAGLMSGMTSAARVWFKMTLTDKPLLEHAAVKAWLDEVRDRIAGVLSRSNFYATLQTFYSDLAVFGTACMIIEEDDDKVIRCTHFALGDYWIGYNAKQQVRVFMREYDLTVMQVVEQFGVLTRDGYETKNFSQSVQDKWRNGQTEQPITITHIITDNRDYNETRLESKHKRFASCYFEQSNRETFLDEGGYDEWPVMVVRWETTTGDIYGTDCPGMTALGDAKELMFTKKLGAQALNKAVNPPMNAHESLFNKGTTILPGGVNWISGNDTDKKFTPAIDTRSFRLDWLREWKNDLRELLDKAFFVDLFLLIANIDRGDVSATEILEKKEEKLLSLGPVVEQVNDGFLDPGMDRVYGIMLRRGLIPEPPPEMEGVAFHPEYESIMAQAQRAQGRTGIEAFSIFVANAAKEDPSVLDRVDVDEMVKKYADATGVPTKFIRPDEDVTAMRQARAQQQAQQAAADNAEKVAGAANKLAGSDTSGQNALTAVLGQGSNVLGGAGPVGGI